MKIMIVDIDRQDSVRPFIEAMTEGWFDPNRTYFELKGRSQTGTAFWGITETLLDTISVYLGRDVDYFLRRWQDGCLSMGTKIKGYHCTRSRNNQTFLRYGILPLSERIIETFLSEITTHLPTQLTQQQRDEIFESILANNTWKYRFTKGAGPYFLLSYKNAKNPDNDFHQSGAEVWYICSDYFLNYCKNNNIDLPFSRTDIRRLAVEGMSPCIVHCSIPYEILSDVDYYAFCILRAHFHFLDPEDGDDLINLFEGYSIDLKGRALEPEHIDLIEELSTTDTI